MLPKSADSETSLADKLKPGLVRPGSVPSGPCDVRRYTCHVRCSVVDLRAVFDVLRFLALFKLKLLGNGR